ncbi:MAG: hypothetical protein ACR2O2_08545 [Ruegeria sp.]
MKIWMVAAAASLISTAAVAEERHFVCVSERDGSEVRLNRAATGDKGSISTKDINGDAMVFNGVGNMTFVHIEKNDVMTFVVHLSDLSYDLSIKGSQAGVDHGNCKEGDA